MVADDLDGDGRPDLLLATFETWPEKKQTIKIFRNDLPNTGNWIGVRLREQGAGVSPVGAKVTVQFAGGVLVRQIVTGDSYRSQHANTVHFGLGAAQEVESLEVAWIGGKKIRLSKLQANRYYDVRAPDVGGL